MKDLGRAHRHRPPSPPTSLPFRVWTLGRIKRQPYHSTCGTYNDDVMLTVMLGGVGTYLREGRRVTVRAGMVGLVLPAGDPGLFMSDMSDPYDHLYCRFGGHEAMRMARRIHHRQNGQWFFAVENWAKLAELLTDALDHPDQTHHGLRAGDVERMRYPDGMLAAALALLDQPALAPRDTGLLSPHHVRRYFRDHLARPTNLAQAAHDLGLSKAHLCRLCQKWFDTSPCQLWTDMKMDWACVLLREPSLTIAEVARRVGYVDPFHFSKVFRAALGQSPRDWRKQHGTTR